MVDLKLPAGVLFKFLLNEDDLEISKQYHILTDDKGE